MPVCHALSVDPGDGRGKPSMMDIQRALTAAAVITGLAQDPRGHSQHTWHRCSILSLAHLYLPGPCVIFLFQKPCWLLTTHSDVCRESQQHKWPLESKTLQLTVKCNQSLFLKNKGDQHTPNGPARDPSGEK